MILARVVHAALWRAARKPPKAPDLEAIREALARAEALLPKPPPPPIPERPKAKVIPFRPKTVPPPPPEPEERASDWDPEPTTNVEEVVREAYQPRDEELLLQEISGCKTLLLEIIRRAAYDWVLYRGSRRLQQRDMADKAYRWLFLEEEGTSDWNERMRDGKYITSFVAICEGLDLDPDQMRHFIKQLDRKNVMSVGRPAEYRRRDLFSRDGGEVHALPSGLVEFDSDPDDGSSY